MAVEVLSIDGSFNTQTSTTLDLTPSSGPSPFFLEPSGEPGIDGSDGRGIVSISLDANQNVIITYTDGTTQNLGPLFALYGNWKAGDSAGTWAAGDN